jgi:integral membrane protein (TIGR01906 family)
MKIAKTAVNWLFILCLPLLLVSLVIGALANSQWLYHYAADKYGVADALAANGLQLSDSELSGIYAGLINYYNSGQKYVYLTVPENGQQVNVLTPNEALHFKDVKGLIRLDYGIFGGALVICLAVATLDLFLWRDRSRLAKSLLGGGILTLALLAVLLVFDRFYGFDRLFVQFHFLFFNNLLWLDRGNMVALFPENLFVDGSTMGFGAITVLALALGGVGWWRLAKENPPPA